MIRSPPLCSRPVIFLRGNGHRPDESHYPRPPKLVLEGALYGTFSPPKSHDTFCPPPFANSQCTWVKTGRFGSFFVVCFLALGGHCLQRCFLYQVLCFPCEYLGPKCRFFMASPPPPPVHPFTQNRFGTIVFFHSSKHWVYDPGDHLKKCRSPGMEECRKRA